MTGTSTLDRPKVEGRALRIAMFGNLFMAAAGVLGGFLTFAAGAISSDAGAKADIHGKQRDLCYSASLEPDLIKNMLNRSKNAVRVPNL